MIYAFIGITVLWLFLFCYIIIASIDFGAGFFALHSKLTGDEKKINHLISRYLNPVWIHRNLVTTVFIGFGVPNGSLNYILSKILVVFLSSSLNFSSNK